MCFCCFREQEELVPVYKDLIFGSLMNLIIQSIVYYLKIW